MSDDHYKDAPIGAFVQDGPDAVAEARKMHHLATADPEPERDGLMTGPAHELKYDLARAEESVAHWISRGVHPTENRALRPGDEGYDDAADAGAVPVEGEQASASPSLETAVSPNAPENADAPKAG